MGWEPIKFLINQPRGAWDSEAAKYFIQEYLRRELKDENIYCQKVSGGVAYIRVPWPIQKLEALLLEYDIAQKTQKEGDFELKKLKVGLN